MCTLGGPLARRTRLEEDGSGRESEREREREKEKESGGQRGKKRINRSVLIASFATVESSPAKASINERPCSRHLR